MTIAQAVALLTQRHLDEAEALYRRVRPGAAEFPLALHHLGIIALQRGKPARAEALIRRSLKLAADVPDALSNLGLALGAQGRLDEAARCFERAVAVHPRYAEAHYNWGLALDTAGRWQEALPCYDRAIALKPGYADAVANRATCLHALKRPTEAAEGYRAALALAPGMHRLHAYLGRALAEGGDTAGARAVLVEAERLLPDDAQAPAALADILYAEGDVAAATAVLARALERLTRAPAPARASAPAPAKRYPVAQYPEAVRAVSERLAARGIDAFLVGGTLLGLVRDGGFLSFDKDVDFGVDAAITPADLLAAFAGDPDFAPNYGTDTDAVLTGLWFKGKVAIDFFRFFRQGEHVWCGVTLNGHLMKWLHRPFALKEARLGGVAVRIPAEPEAFLAECYGEGWRRPDPYFGLFASPNIEGGFPPLSRCVAYGAMVRAAITADRPRLEALCRQVLALAPEDEAAQAVAGWLGESSSSPPGLTRGSMDGRVKPGHDGKRRPSQTNAQAAVLQAVGHAFDDLPG